MEIETKEKAAEEMVEAEHSPGKQMEMTTHQEILLESEVAFTTNNNSTSILTRSSLKSHPLSNNYDRWKRKVSSLFSPSTRLSPFVFFYNSDSHDFLQY